MHTEAFQFVADARGRLAPNVTKLNILEIGSYNVNGSVRPLFAGAHRYHGIDVRPGPDVDEVADAAQFEGEESFDIVVSTEVLEHAPHPKKLIDAAWRALKPGGYLILTAAGPGRTPHGVDGGPVGEEPYHNIEPKRLETWLSDWADVEVQHNADVGDTYATARKPAHEHAGHASGRGAKPKTTTKDDQQEEVTPDGKART